MIVLGIFAIVAATVVGVYFLTSNFDQNELKQGVWTTSNDQVFFNDTTKINETVSDDYDKVSENIINQFSDGIEDKEKDTKEDQNILLMVGGFSRSINKSFNQVEVHEKVLTECEVLGSDLYNCKGVPQHWPFPFYSQADVNYLLAFFTGTGILLCNEALGLCYLGDGGDWKTINFSRSSKAKQKTVWR